MSSCVKPCYIRILLISDATVCWIYSFKLNFPLKHCLEEILEDTECVNGVDLFEAERKEAGPEGAEGRVMNEGVILVEWMKCIASARTSDADDTFPPTTPAEEK